MYGSLCCRPGGPSALAWRSGLGPCWWSPVRMTGDREGCFRPRTSAAGERIGVERRAWRLGGRDGVERRAWRRGELAGWYGGPGSWADGAARGSRRSGKASQQARAASAAARQGSKQGQQAQRQGKPASKGRIMGASRDGHGRARTRNGQGRAWVCPDLDVASKQAGLAGGQAGRAGRRAGKQASRAGGRSGMQASRQASRDGWVGLAVDGMGRSGGWRGGTTPLLCVLKRISYYRDSAFDHRHRVGHGERVRSRESAKLRCLLRRRSRCSRRGTWHSGCGAGASTSWAQGGALAIWTGELDWTWTGRDLDWTGGWTIAGADGGLGDFKLRDPGRERRQDSAAGGRAD